MNKEKVRELKAELANSRRRYRDEKRQIKIEYKARKRIYSERIAAAKKEKAPEGMDLSKVHLPQGRVSYLLDSITLKLCEPFEVRAADIRYRRHDPEGWEADHLVSEITEVVKFYQNRVQKGKELKPRDLEVLMKIHSALSTITTRGAGQHQYEAQTLKETVENILPPEAAQPLQQLDNLFNQATAAIDQMFTAPMSDSGRIEALRNMMGEGNLELQTQGA